MKKLICGAALFLGGAIGISAAVISNAFTPFGLISSLFCFFGLVIMLIEAFVPN